MKTLIPILLILVLAIPPMAQPAATPQPPPAKPSPQAAPPAAAPDAFPTLKAIIEKHLGRPYGWGSTGLKSFDCSGFVWRVMSESGILLKRTTARKLYMCLPELPAERQWQFGNIVFFDNLKHCGIVSDKDTFYHAQTSKGTNLSPFRPYWRPKVCGVRGQPVHLAAQ